MKSLIELLITLAVLFVVGGAATAGCVLFDLMGLIWGFLAGSALATILLVLFMPKSLFE